MLRASPQKREEKERVRAALLRAALELGASHGFASLGLREVARAADIAPTSFYRHFTDMGELGRALVDEQVAPLLSELAGRVVAADAVASASALIENLFAAVTMQPELIRFLVAERVGAFPALRAAMASKLALLAAALQQAAQERKLFTGETALALLLDGFARALDVSEADTAELRRKLVESISLALARP